MSAADFLDSAREALGQRAALRDTPSGERSAVLAGNKPEKLNVLDLAARILNYVETREIALDEVVIAWLVMFGCGMDIKARPKNFNNLAGRRFGRLVALAPLPDKKEKLEWMCICDCGQFAYANTSNLIGGRQISCGCFAMECRLNQPRSTPEQKKAVRRRASIKYAQSLKGKEKRQQAYERNREKYNERCANWRKANPEKVRAFTINRRAKKRQAQGTHTANDVLRIGGAQKWRCAICSVNIKNKYHVDHIHPLSKGGTNDPLNLQLLCPTCNVRKSDKDYLEYMQSRGFLL